MLDIHTINTGRGNCQYIVLPDGTTMMIDAGDFDKTKYKDQYYPMTCAEDLPDTKHSAAEVIANYISKIKSGENRQIDYFLLTHFHSDHFGCIKEGIDRKDGTSYYLNGVTELHEYIPIKQIIDRCYPDYDYPVPLYGRKNKDGSDYDSNVDNYIDFVHHNVAQGTMVASSLSVGSDKQFVLVNHPSGYPEFKITGIKKNDELWTGPKGGVISLFDSNQVSSKGLKVKENQLSCAIVLEYGSFRYYAGGDNSGLVDQDHEEYLDIESVMAPVIGKVSAMSLNHHGNRDGSNLNFLNMLDPKIVLLQTWSSDQPGEEVGHRLISKNVGTRERDIFATWYCPQSGQGKGPWFEREIKAKNGHILLRVYPDKHYEVFILDATSNVPNIIEHYGPYSD